MLPANPVACTVCLALCRLPIGRGMRIAKEQESDLHHDLRETTTQRCSCQMFLEHVRTFLGGD